MHSGNEWSGARASAGANAAVTAGLFVAWALHDVEEALTMPGTSELIAHRLEQSSRPLVRRLAPRVRTDAEEAAVAIALMGGIVAAAAADGLRTRGRSLFFQCVLAGLQAHIGTHVAATLRLRRYSTGVVTAVVLLAPYCRWARGSLRTTGALIEGPRPYLLGVALLLPATITCHALARRLLR